MAQTASPYLSLREAMMRWCDHTLVAAVQQAAAKYGASDAKGTRGPVHPNLRAAWQQLLDRFQSRIASGQLIIKANDGIPQGPLIILPRGWAGDLDFDLERDVVSYGDRRFYNARVAQAEAPTAESDAFRLNAQTEMLDRTFDPSKLSDEQILEVIAEHEKRVVEDRTGSLFPPGKISLMPIIRRKMRYRQEQGERAPTIGEEATALAKWIQGKLPAHPTPTVKAIENSIRTQYRSLQAQSKHTSHSGDD